MAGDVAGRRGRDESNTVRSHAVSLLTVSAAFGADLAAPPIAPAPPPPFTWTSCYAGGNVGGGFGQKDLNDTAGILSPNTGFTSANLNISGYMLGGQIGCDYQFASNWILGIEGAASGGDIGGTTTVTTPGEVPATPRPSKTPRIS